MLRTRLSRKRFRVVSTDFETRFVITLRGLGIWVPFSLQVGQGNLINKGREGPCTLAQPPQYRSVFTEDCRSEINKQESLSEKAPVGP